MARNSRSTAPGSAATHRRSWWSLRPPNNRRPGVCNASSTNTRSQPSLSPRGRPNLWRSHGTKGGQSLFSPTRAVSLSTAFLSGSSLSIWRVFYALPLTWQRRSATSISAV